MKEIPNYKFNKVRIANRDEVYVSSSIDQLNKDEIDNTVIHRYHDGKWMVMSSTIWGSAGMLPLTQEGGGLMCVATGGEVFEFPSESRGEHFIESQGEHVDRSPDGPSSLVQLRCVERIGARIYCAGFARRVYVRSGKRAWTSVDDGTFLSRDLRTKAIGFFALGGLTEDEFYAAGLNGEIWSCREGRWTEESSPTDVALNTISVLPSGLACMAGMVGTVVCGRAGQWSKVNHSVSEEPFWGSTIFKGQVFLANNEGVYVLDEAGGELRQVYNGRDSASSSYLDASDGVMWSVGDKGIAKTDNGSDWSMVPGPTK